MIRKVDPVKKTFILGEKDKRVVLKAYGRINLHQLKENPFIVFERTNGSTFYVKSSEISNIWLCGVIPEEPTRMAPLKD